MELTANTQGESLFTWKGDAAAIDKLSTELEAPAAETDRSGKTIADNALGSVGKGGLPLMPTREDSMSLPNEQIQSDAVSLGGPQMPEARACLYRVFLDGLQHGHFRCTIFSAVGKGKQRELVIEAGKSHKFTIPEAELPR
jgi:hypothetical protein